MNLFLAEIPVWNGSAETTLKFASGLGYTNGPDSQSVALPAINVRRNLLTYSEDFSNGAWIKDAVTVTSNAALAPNGTQTADLLIPSIVNAYHGIYYQGLSNSGVNGGYTLYAKASGYNKIRVWNGAGVGYSVDIDLQAAQIINIGGSVVSATVTQLDNGWVEIKLVELISVYFFISVLREVDGAYTPFEGDGVSGIYIWGADLRYTADIPRYPLYQRITTATDYDPGPYPALAHDGTDWYAPRIENPATYSVSLNAGGLASGSYGELTLVNVDGALDALADYAVDGRFLTLKYGDEDAAYNTFTTVLVAMMESISLERDRVSIRLRDPARQLDKPITTRTYAGTGGLAGDATLKDAPKPIVVGEATFIRPVLIDAARLIYQVHDGYVPDIQYVLNKAGQVIASGGDFASEATLLDNGTNLLPTGWGDFESGDNDPYVNPTAEVIKVTAPSGNASYVRNWGTAATFDIALSTNTSTYNITSLTAGQKYRLTAKVLSYPNVSFRFKIWTASGAYYGPYFTAQYGMADFSAVIDLVGDANTAIAVGIEAILNTYDMLEFDKFTVTFDPVVTAGTFRAWRDVNGSYIRLGSDPAGDIVVTTSEYINGGFIGLLPGHALYRLATEYGHIITQPVTTSGAAQSVASDRLSITLATGASATNDAYNTQYIKVIDGDFVQIRTINDYVGSTKVATLDAALQTLSNGTPAYEIAPGVIWKDGNNYAAELQAVSDAYRNLTADQTGTAQGGGTGNNQIQLATSASSTDDIYNGKTVIILSGTGSGQERTISDYVGSTRTATVSSNWTTNPNNTSVYEINEAAAVRLRNAGVGIFTGDAANLKSLMDQVAESVHAWYAFDATNKLRMGLFRDPDDETSVATLTEDNILTLDRVTDSNPESLPNWRVTVNSGKRWNPLNANDAIPASLINLTKGWANTSKQTDSTIKPVHKLSTERSFDSLMIDADGQRGDLLATDLLTLYKARHDTVNATVADPNLEFKAIDIGTVVTLQVSRFGYNYGRFGYNSGRKLRVISLRRDFQRGILDLTLWG